MKKLLSVTPSSKADVGDVSLSVRGKLYSC